MRLLAIAAAFGFYIWAVWRSLPPQFHHVICIVACWLAWAVLAAIILRSGQ